MNFLSFIILAIILICVYTALKKIYEDRKDGKGCYGECSGCSKNCTYKNKNI